MKLRIRRLLWDDWNVAHIARHEVVPEEVVEVCQGEFILLRGKKGRVVVVGPSSAGRMLAVVLNPQAEEGVFYPVTARPAAKKERRIYQEQKGGENHDGQ